MRKRTWRIFRRNNKDGTRFEIANETIRSESKRRRNAEMMYQDFQKLHRAAVRNEENALSDLRKQLEQDFEQRVLEMKERFEAERAQWEAQTVASRNAAQSAQARSTQEINRIKEDMRLEVHSLERRLKVTTWEQEDERKMRVEADQSVHLKFDRRRPCCMP